jgi:hypothetical protein
LPSGFPTLCGDEALEPDGRDTTRSSFCRERLCTTILERGARLAESSVDDARGLKMRGYAAVDGGHPSTDGLPDRGPLIWKLSS